MVVFLPSLKKSGHLDQIHMTLCSVGSRKLSAQDDYASRGWSIFAPNLTIYGFDADADACDIANADLENRQINWTEKHIPLALGKSVGESTLYVTQHPMCSSLYPPNEEYLKRFQGLPELVNLDFTVEIETTTLDEFCRQEEISSIDFLQIDVQGADLDVLKGAKTLIQNVLAIQIEVEFSPLYLDQPLFSDIDFYLRQHDFTLFNLLPSYRTRKISPIQSNRHPGQLLWGEAFYLRDPLQAKIKNPERIFKLACMADAMAFTDYALELMEYLTTHYGHRSEYNLADDIVTGLADQSNLLQQGLASLPIISKLRDHINIPIPQSQEV